MKESFDHLEQSIDAVRTELKETMKAGFESVVSEVRLLRTDGMMPISLVEKILDKTDNRNNKFYDKLLTIFMVTFLLILGLKLFIPNVFGQV